MSRTMRGRPLALLVLIIMLAGMAAGCGWLWPRDNPMDPARCDPSCPRGLVCVEGICKLGDGGWPFDGFPVDSPQSSVLPDSAAAAPDQTPVTPDLPAPDQTMPDQTIPDLPPAAEQGTD